jgi:hypothetical protein
LRKPRLKRTVVNVAVETESSFLRVSSENSVVMTPPFKPSQSTLAREPDRRNPPRIVQ